MGTKGSMVETMGKEENGEADTDLRDVIEKRSGNLDLVRAEESYLAAFQSKKKAIEKFLKKRLDSIDGFFSYCFVACKNHLSTEDRTAFDGTSLVGHACAVCTDNLSKNAGTVVLSDQYEWTPLHYACAFSGNVNLINSLLKHTVQLDARTRNGETALMLACFKGSSRVVEILIKGGANINLTDHHGWSALHYACAYSGNPRLVRILLKHRITVDARTRDKETALILASFKGFVEVAEALIKGGARLDLADNDGWAAIHYACAFSTKYKLVPSLLQHDIDVNVVTGKGETALMLASCQGRSKVVETLIDYRASLQLTDKNKWSALHYACAFSGKCNLVRTLLEHARNLEAETDSGETALTLARSNGFPEIVYILLEYKARYDLLDKSSMSTLHDACIKGHSRLANKLSKRETNIKLKSVDGQTTLNPPVQLSKRETDTNLPASNGQATLHSPVQPSKPGVETNLKSVDRQADLQPPVQLPKPGVDTNLNAVDGQTTLHSPVGQSSPDCTSAPVDDGVKSNISDEACLGVSAVDKMGNSLLHNASARNNTSLMLELLNAGANHNIRNDHGATPLHEACIEGFVNCVHILLDNRANVNSQDIYGATAVIRACQYGNDECLTLLLKAKPDLSLSMKATACTALHMSCRNRHVKCIELLVAAGIDINAVNNKGETALSICFFNVECFDVKPIGQTIDNVDKAGEVSLSNKEATAVVKRASQCVALLLKAKPDLTLMMRDSRTALQKSCRKGHTRCSKLLLKPSSNSDDQAIPNLMCLSFHKGCDSLQLLYELARLERVDEYGVTPLMLTVMAGCLKCSKEVMLRMQFPGQQLRAKDKWGNTAFDYARIYLLKYTESLCDQNIFQWQKICNAIRKMGAREGVRKNKTANESNKCELAFSKKLNNSRLHMVYTPKSLQGLSEEEEISKHALYGDTCPVNLCKYHWQARKLFRILDISDEYIDENLEKCFCEICIDEFYCLAGDPPAMYGAPVGWVRFGLKYRKPEHANGIDIGSKWHSAYHGTCHICIESIIENGSLKMASEEWCPPWVVERKDGPAYIRFPPPKSYEEDKVYLSPSIRYAGHPEYAPAYRFRDPEFPQYMRKARVVFEVLIQAGSYLAKPSVLPEDKIDPGFPNSEINWCTRQTEVLTPIGLLVKIESDDPNQLEKGLCEDIPYARLKEMLRDETIQLPKYFCQQPTSASRENITDDMRDKTLSYSETSSMEDFGSIEHTQSTVCVIL